MEDNFKNMIKIKNEIFYFFKGSFQLNTNLMLKNKNKYIETFLCIDKSIYINTCFCPVKNKYIY